MLNWRFLRPNFWPVCVAIWRDIARHGFYSYIWFTRMIPDLFIQKLIFSLLVLDFMRNLPIIIHNNHSKFIKSCIYCWSFWATVFFQSNDRLKVVMNISNTNLVLLLEMQLSGNISWDQSIVEPKNYSRALNGRTQNCQPSFKRP